MNIVKLDPDIPVVAVNAVPVPVRPQLAKGRSERISFPNGKSYALRDDDINRLKEQGFPSGLAKAMTRNNLAFPLRIWVVDNSGSMVTNDGHRMIATLRKEDVKVVGCTRWAEIQQTVEYHAQMAALLRAPTVFRLLNDPGRAVGAQQFGVADKGDDSNTMNEVSMARQIMRTASPGGVTPLAQHVLEIKSNVEEMEASLLDSGAKVAVVLATDGLPTDHRGVCDDFTKTEFVSALRSLEGLPIWLVVRLCTDDESVVSFYNELDRQLEFSIEVLDDFLDESKEVDEHNGWLNYALPLHRCREMGYHNRLFDLLDERKLTPDEMRDMLFLIFGEENFDGFPDPQGDWKGFMRAVQMLLNKEKKQWNPSKKRVTPWIDLKKLDRAYKPGGGCSIM